jgi:hypothetical protein
MINHSYSSVPQQAEQIHQYNLLSFHSSQSGSSRQIIQKSRTINRFAIAIAIAIAT